mmetsp:Transcript_28318/g.71037  ORF Transcript_28318/g.71037 Transcript_28318/m.71037 type:complete len:295 (+) Transcript_28318:1-885(+)
MEARLKRYGNASWVKETTRFAAASGMGDLLWVYDDADAAGRAGGGNGVGGDGAVCFRSVILAHTNVGHELQSHYYYQLGNDAMFYARNGLNTARHAEYCASLTAKGSAPLVYVFDRSNQRRFVDVDEGLVARIESLATGGLRIEKTEFSELPFAEQVGVMQRADAVVAAHGAGIANAVYMRQGTVLVEVFPFGYAPRVFAQVVARRRLAYHRAVAAPDYESFGACLRKRKSTEEEVENAVETMRKMYEKVAKTEDKIRMSQMNVCLRHQDLKPDYDEIASLVLDGVKNLCHSHA